MAESIQLNVKLNADGSGLVANVDDVARAFQRLDRNIKKTGDDTAKSATRSFQQLDDVVGRAAKRVAAFAAIAAGAGVAALVALTRKGLEAGDSLAKAASKLDIATKSLAGLRLAAERTGVAQETLDKAIGKLNINVGKGITIGGQYAKVFDQLGLNMRDLAKLDTDKRLGVIADAINRIGNTTERSAALALLFGDRIGVDMVNTLRLGSAGLAEFQHRAEVAGTALSEVAAKNIEAANDAMEDVGMLWSGLGQQLAANVAPVLAEVSDRLFAVAEEAGGMGNIATKVFDAIVEAIAVTLDWVGRLVDVVKVIGLGWETLGNAFARFINGILSIANHALANSAILRWMFGADQAISQEDLAFRTKVLDDSLDRLRAAFDAIVLDSSRAGDAVRIFVEDATRKYTGAAQKVIDANANVADSAATTAMTIEELAKAERGLMDYLGRKDLERAKEVNRQKKEEAKALAAANKAAADEVARAWEHATERIDTVFADVWKGAFESFTDFSRALKDAFKQLLAEMAHFAITRPILVQLGLLGGTAGGILGGAGGAGGLLGNLSTAGGLAGLGGLLGGGLAGLLPLLQTGGGAFAGGLLGDALWGNREGATGGLLGLGGAAIGTALIPVLGPLGPLIGGFVGDIVDKAFGSDPSGKRIISGVTAGGTGGAAPVGTRITAASGLKLGAISYRAEDFGAGGVADDLLQAFAAIDEVLTATAKAAGVTVDFSNTVLKSQIPLTKDEPLGFFGSFAKGQINAAELEGAAADFVAAWLAEINNQLPARVRAIIGGVNGTADQIANAFALAVNIDTLLDLDVVEALNAALDELGQSQGTILDQYTRANEALLEISSAYDGTYASLEQLTAALLQQKNIAAQVALAYQAAGEQVSATFGSAIDYIRESVLTDEELYNLRVQQINELTAQLASTIDPGQIASITQQIDQLARGAFGILDPEQQQALAAGFVSFLTEATALAEAQLGIGLAQLQEREAGVAGAVNLDLLLDAAGVQSAAAQQFAESVIQFGTYIQSLGGTVAIPPNEGSPVFINSEVNIPLA